MSDFDEVKKPEHYNTMGEKDEQGRAVYEPIKVIEGWGYGEGFCIGNAIKYILRAPHKGTERTDLEKAYWYLQRVGDAWTRPYSGSLGPMAVAQAWKLPGRLQLVLEHIFETKYMWACCELAKHLNELKAAREIAEEEDERILKEIETTGAATRSSDSALDSLIDQISADTKKDIDEAMDERFVTGLKE